MAYVDRYVGSDMVVEFTPAGGSLLVVSADATDVSLTRSTDTVDVTAGNEKFRQYIPTITASDGSMTTFAGSPTVTVALTPGARGLMDIYPKGKIAGMPKIRFNAIITEASLKLVFDSATEMSYSFMVNGAFIWQYPDIV